MESRRQQVLKGELDIDEASKKNRQEINSSGIYIHILYQDHMFNIIHNIRFPSFWRSFYKLESWAEPGVNQKITRVELIKGKLEFTIQNAIYPN